MTTNDKEPTAGFVLDLLVAAGHITREKADECMAIARPLSAQAAPTAHPALLAIADEIQSWLDWHAREFLPEQITDDQHVYSMPVYPTRGTLNNWIAALKEFAK